MSYTLTNDYLTVQFRDTPSVLAYHHKKTGHMFKGGLEDGGLIINGEFIAWTESQIEVIETMPGSAIQYLITLPNEPHAQLEIVFELIAEKLHFAVRVCHDPARWLRTLAWHSAAFLRCENTDFHFFREAVRQISWRRIKFTRQEEAESLNFCVVDPAPVSAIQACVSNGDVCAFVHTNALHMPLATRLVEHPDHCGRCGGVEIFPGSYQFRARDKDLAPLEGDVVFLEDMNGDGQADENDYLLWVNRQMPDPDPLFLESFWYKISCADLGRGLATSFDESLELVEAIYNITDGLPQIAYLAGWKFDGWDGKDLNYDLMGFGGMEALSQNPGTLEELRHLHKTAREKFNTTISYHINVDDSYTEYPLWDESIICKETDGKFVEWLNMFGRIGYHINHTKDVESGKVFQRLEKFLEQIPVEKTIHLDAFRNTNCSWEPDGFIGMVEELECGVKPILDFLNEKGLVVSLENARAMPIQQVGFVPAYWHMTPISLCVSRLMLFHRKAIGGGTFACPDRVRWGFGSAINMGFCYRPVPEGGDLSLTHDWDRIVDEIYLGYMLYRFYLQRELLDARQVEDEYHLRFADGVCTAIDTKGEHLNVIWGEVVIASDDDRFLPFQNEIYAYSKTGGERTYQLPPEWHDNSLQACVLSRDGRVAFTDFVREGNELSIDMPSQQPVKFTR